MPFKKFNTYGKEEIKAASEVIKTGQLSNFIGEWGSNFYGGKKVKQMEKKFADFFKVKYAISVNSWTSGLICAVGAIDISPGDEIILPTWTMSACAASILHWNAIPVFADISMSDLCIDPESVKKNISKKTKAIMAVDISGRSAKINEIKKIARKHNLKIISDTAQSPMATYNKKYAGTLADIGGLSLNCHKHIHTGEGGVIFTNNKKYAEKMKMIRNHAEAVLRKRNNFPLINMLGNNFRLGEIEASIAIVQLKKLKKIINKRIYIANYLTKKLSEFDGLILPKIHTDFTNVYYTYPIILNPNMNFNRKKILYYLKKEGVEGMGEGYQNLHLLPLFKKKTLYGKTSFPWNSEFNKRKISYIKGICPIAEKLHDELFIGFGISHYDLKKLDVDFIYKKFKKILGYTDIYQTKY
jgi:dTDP-4-amino-4,6-dideoxygalactose transaminase